MNASGLTILKGFESCQLTAYRDPKGIWTIGYGCTHHVTPGMTITQGEADSRLVDDIAEFEQEVQKILCPLTLNEDEFSAVTCFVYNVGEVDFKLSTLLLWMKLRHFDDAAKEFPRWCKVDGVRTKGVFRRRMAEQSLFTGDLEAMDKYVNDVHSVDSLF